MVQKIRYGARRHPRSPKASRRHTCRRSRLWRPSKEDWRSTEEMSRKQYHNIVRQDGNWRRSHVCRIQDIEERRRTRRKENPSHHRLSDTKNEERSEELSRTRSNPGTFCTRLVANNRPYEAIIAQECSLAMDTRPTKKFWSNKEVIDRTSRLKSIQHK